jgi:hypothetical protein
MSVLGLFGAMAAVVWAYVNLGHPDGCTGLPIPHGASIHLAWTLVGYTAVAALVALSVLEVAQQRGRLLAVLLSIEATALTVAIGLVLADSATFVVDSYACYLQGNTGAEYSPTPAYHVDWLFAVWGVPTAFLVLRAVGAWRAAEPLDRPVEAAPAN